MSYRPKYLGHVNIFVRNAERSQRWYADVLGLHTYGFRPGWAAFMAADLEQSHEVALIQVGDEAAGISLGIYFRDPDGNGVEVSYELPRSQWPREERVFDEDMGRGRLPGPWDADPAAEKTERTVHQTVAR